MTPENFERTLRTFQRSKPFRSFTVELLSGETLHVDHPETLVLRDGLAVFVAAGGFPHLFDHDSVSRVPGELKAEATTLPANES